MTEITYGQWRRGFWQAIIAARFWHGRSGAEYQDAMVLAARILATMPDDTRTDCIRNLSDPDEMRAILENWPEIS